MEMNPSVLIVEDITKMIAVEAKLPSIQLSALENVHYSHMIRFDNVEEARRLQLEIDKLKQSKVEELDEKNIATDCCSETDTEGDDHCSDDMSSACLEVLRKSNSNGSVPLEASGESNDDLPLISLIRPSKRSSKNKTADTADNNISKEPDETSPKTLSKSTSNQQTVVGRKRVRLVLSDDEGDVPHEVECSARRLHRRPVDFAASDEFTRKISPASSDNKLQDTSPVASRSPSKPCNLVNIEESTCSYKSVSNRTVSNGKNTRSLSNAEVVIGSDYADSASKCDINASENLLHRHNSPLKLQATDNEVDGCMEFKIDDNKINVAVSSFMAGDKISIESLKVELACLYYLQLPVEKRSKGGITNCFVNGVLLGLLPIIQNMECGGRPLESIENLDSLRNHLMKVSVDVLINGMCNNCGPFGDCFPGNGTMEKLQQFFSSSGQKYGDLTLDLHCNRFGPTALFQVVKLHVTPIIGKKSYICECPVLFTRLEVLNISGNRLTDACGSYLSTILEKCRGKLHSLSFIRFDILHLVNSSSVAFPYNNSVIHQIIVARLPGLTLLNIERCSITSRTIQKVADALDTGSVLSQLFIGHNNPISGNAISSLLVKLAILKRFSEFSLNGLKLSKTVVDGLCHRAKTSCLSRLMLEGTAIGTEPLKLDLSFCGVVSTYIYELNTNVIFISGILELHLGGNPIMQEGGNALASLLMNPQCCLKVLNLKKCQLGMAGILQIVHALAENESLEELNLANNADTDKQLGILYCKPTHSLESSQPNHIVSEPSLNPCSSKEFDELDPNYNKLEVADSEDDEVRVETAASGFNDSSASSCQRRNSTLECQFIQELSIAIGLAKQLQVLDLSKNGLSVQASEALYNAWSSGSRAGLSCWIIKDQIVHLSVEGNKCCRLKSCCKKD
ncbi:protein TONSOKU-like isoform X1 [Gossypium australe]|uniref:Protein TONSOKU-like isoform X1 n=1 Tax=Gossypium australe TaxID=47621 RepID=A0A5B6W7S8_9ROSI|nr:protein TONSOKU-like isoform X1 [Gossypium australe]